MSVQHLPGATLVMLDPHGNPAGDVEVVCYVPSEKAYKVWWTYPQTSEREMITVPEWRLVKKVNEQTQKIKAIIKRSYADRFFKN